MDNLSVGIIGLGVGESHIAGYEKHQKCRVTKICDNNLEVLQEVNRRNYGKIPVTDPNDIIFDSSIDIVSIATYDDCHKDQVIASLKNGKHVFVEKPLCLNKEELSSILSTMRENPQLRVSSNLILRRCPRFIDLRKRIMSGQLGQIFHIESSYDYGRLNKLTGGWRGRIPSYSVTLGGGIHLIDLMHWVSGEKFTEVFAYGNKLSTKGSSFPGYSLTAAVMKSTSGCTASLTSNFGSVTPHHHKISIYGTEATFEQSHSDTVYFFSRDSEKLHEKVNSVYPGTQKGDLLYDFIDSIIREKKPIIEAQEVIDVMSVGLAIDESIKNQNPQKVEYLRVEK